MKNYPVYAVIGKTNKGKSTLVATLTENEEIKTAYEEGTTTQTKCYPYRHNKKKLFELCDTPGFENQRKMLRELKKSMEDVPSDDTSIHLRSFYDLYENREEFNFGMETEILKPIFNGASIVYVVRGTDPFNASVMNEIEILKWADRPMLAILNIDTEENESQEITNEQKKNLEKWEKKLRRDFNIVKRFNPFRATIEDKMELLDAIKILDESWKSHIDEAKTSMLKSTCDRIENTAEIFTELMQESLEYKKNIRLEKGQEIKTNLKALELNYKEKIQSIEEKRFKEIKEIWKHNNLSEQVPEIEKTKLFSQASHEIIEKEMTYLYRGTSGAAIGAILGATVDILSFGITLGAGTAIGTAIGAALGVGEAWTEIDNVSDTDKIKWLSKGFTIGGKDAPPALELELYVRALSFSIAIAGRSHGNRNDINIKKVETKQIEEKVLKELHNKFKKGSYTITDTENYRLHIRKILIDEILGDKYKHICSHE